ncbi:MAG: hypothetical protein ACFFAN_03275 [Promethearchaeota archaeon]
MVDQIPSKLNIYRIEVFKCPKNIYLNRYLHWIPRGYLKGKKIIKRNKDIKFIFATYPSFPTLVIGYLLKMKFKIPLIVEYRDPWNFNPYYKKEKRAPIELFNLFQEILILKSVDIIFTVSSALKSFLLSNFPQLKNKPIIVLESGLKLIKNANYNNVNPNKIEFTFTGTLYRKRTVFPFLKIISDLNREGFFKEIDFLFKIYGKYNEKLIMSHIKKLNIGNLIYLGGFISRKEVYREIFNSNLGVHIGEDLNYPTISFKIWDYLSVRRKILYIGREDSYTANFLKENDFGFVLPINDLDKAKVKLKNLINNIRIKNFNKEIEENKLKIFKWDNKIKRFKFIIEKIKSLTD